MRGQVPPRAGQAALVAVVFMLFLMLSGVFGASAVALKEAKAAEEGNKSRSSFFAAEAGVDDAIYRIKRNKNVSLSFSLALNGATATTTVANLPFNKKEIKSTGNYNNALRGVSSVLSAGTGASFYYGVQVGDGGVSMGNNSVINGNIFSNGDIAGSGQSQSMVSGNAQAAGAHSISNVWVNNGASAHSFDRCIVDGIAKYVSAFTNCTASSTQVLQQDIAPQNLPIIQSQIDGWKNEAVGGGTQGNTVINNNQSLVLGPKKIAGDLTLNNNATLTVSGTLWVTGNISLGNTCSLKLSPTYGNLSGVIITDGTVDASNNCSFAGSGTQGSYIMILSTKNSPLSQVMDISNNSFGVIFYAANGRVHLNNNSGAKEVTAYGIDMDNNTSITYESGLANMNFSSGPSGGWSIDSWGEIQP